jgi:hypothetical protein
MESDLSALEQLVTSWRQRAESLRGGGSETLAALARAEAYDTCAAQLAQALAGARSSSAPAQEGQALELFE